MSYYFFSCPEPPPPDTQREALIAAVAILCGALITFVFVALFGKPSMPTLTATASPTPTAPAPKLARADTKHTIPTVVTPELLQALMEARRSIQPKNMTGNVVPATKVDAILRAAPWAPNHGKTEPWRFVVFQGAAGKEKLLNLTLQWYRQRPAQFWNENFLLGGGAGPPEFADAEAFASYFTKAAADKWGKASHLVAIGVRRQRKEEGKKQHPMWEEDCAVACAVQNMHLLATALGVGAYWSSWYAHYREDEQCAKDLGLEPSAGDRCLGVFVIGEMEAGLSNRAARKPVTEIARWEK